MNAQLFRPMEQGKVEGAFWSDGLSSVWQNCRKRECPGWRLRNCTTSCCIVLTVSASSLAALLFERWLCAHMSSSHASRESHCSTCWVQ